jgi:hypothetical protein
LTARPGRALDLDAQILVLVDLDLDLVCLRHDDHGRGRRVDAPARLRRGDALDAVYATLELEPAVGTVATHLDDGFLDAVDAGLIHAEHLGRELVATRVAEVHA